MGQLEWDREPDALPDGFADRRPAVKRGAASGTSVLSDGSGIMFGVPCGYPCRASEQRYMRNIFRRTELEFKPFGPSLAKVRLGVGAQTSLNCAGKAQVQQMVGVQMREFAAPH